jgi:nucleotide-binding universal stress UspA family protein
MAAAEHAASLSAYPQARRRVMLKRILVLLAETASSKAAQDYAFRLAKQSGAEVTGLAGIDLTFIEQRMPGRAGAAAFKARLEEQLKTQAEGARQRLHDSFEQECRDHNVTFEWLSFEGDPVGSLYLATESRDLLVSGHDTAFRGNVREPLSEMLSNLMQMTPRPLVVCPDDLPSGDEILVAYDGSVPAMRALQIFVLMGLGAGRRVQVTSIDEDQEMAARRASGAAGYLRSHGIEVSVDPIATSVHPGEVLKIEVPQRGIGMMVMGAYGHRGFREMLFGSTTADLTGNPPCCLFLYH